MFTGGPSGISFVSFGGMTTSINQSSINGRQGVFALGAGGHEDGDEDLDAGMETWRRGGGEAAGLGTNQRPAPQIATVTADDGRGDCVSRWANVAGKGQDADEKGQRAHGNSVVSSRQRVNDGNPSASRQQAHGAVFSGDHR